ncbi:MAG: hypothetical protein ACYCVB_08315 [Bacilli bacterium]
MKTGHSQVRKPLQRMTVHRGGLWIARTGGRKGGSARATARRNMQPLRCRGKRRVPQLQGAQRIAKVTSAQGGGRRKSVAADVTLFSLGVSSAPGKGIKRHTAERRRPEQAPARAHGQTRQSASGAGRRGTKRSSRKNETLPQSSHKKKPAEDAGKHGGRLQSDRLSNGGLFLMRLKQARTITPGGPYQVVKTPAPRPLIMAPPLSLPTARRSSSSARSRVFDGLPESTEVDPAQVRKLTRRMPARVVRPTEDSSSASPPVAVAVDDSDAAETAHSDVGEEERDWVGEETQDRAGGMDLEHLLEAAPDTDDSELPMPQQMETEEWNDDVIEHSFPEPCDMSECTVIGEPWDQIMGVFSGDYRIPDEDILLVLMDELQSHAEEQRPTAELGAGAATG